MKKFLDRDFLLDTNTAKHLYHDYAQNMPIIDYHCHLSPKEIYEDIRYSNITELWLGGDHYKWRQMRANGVKEQYITGNASDKDKFIKWAKTLEMAIGNPLYHWSHLELKRYFGYEGYLSLENAEEVWNFCNNRLNSDGLSSRKLIEMSKVEVICTTDDPVDSLYWHKKLREDKFKVKVLPTWRPDKALQIEKDGFLDYLTVLSSVSGVEITDFDSLVDALRIRLEFFVKNGCKVSDHGLTYIMYEDYNESEVNEIIKKKIEGELLTEIEQRKYKTAFMVAMGKEYACKNLVMQIHYGVIRDLNKKIYNDLGADAGIDAINNYSSSTEMGKYLNALSEVDLLPKTIIYPLNSSDFDALGTVIGCFQDSSTIGKIQHGSGWWFNDNKAGMIKQMTSLANLGLLGNFIGMLTDSRSFLSYTRHEYFRRIMCNLIGNLVENGEYPNDERSLKKIVEGISYNNAKRYFDF